MEKAAPAADVERRKQVRIRLRGDLSILPQKYEGRTYYVVKDPISLRYYRFKEQEHYLLQFLDVEATLDHAQKQYEKRFRPERLTLEDLEAFAQQLLRAGLAQNESPKAGEQLFERRKKRRRSEWMQLLTNVLYIKIPVFDPERLLSWMLGYLWWMFTLWFLFVSVGVMLAAVLLVATHFQTFRDKLPSYHEFFQFKTVIYLWIALGVVKVIHEFGHGLSCKAFGGEVHEMGALLLCLSPCLYCNVSDAWTLPNKWKRIIISSAGIYVELMIAAIATFVWWNTPSHPFVNHLSLSLMVVCSVSTVVFNANPLMRYDGYYVLADLLEIPNLRDRANRFLKNLVLEHCLGVEVHPEPYMALWRKVLFVSYAVVSYIYRWVVTFVILVFLDSFLKPYKLGVVSRMLTLAAVGSMVGWPLYRLGKSIYQRGRLPDMKRWRVTVTAIGVAVLLLLFLVLPLPVSRVRDMALVEFQPEATVKVFVHQSSILDKIDVHEGDWVEKGQVLAHFIDPELDLQLLSLETEYAVRRDYLPVLRRKRDETQDRQEQDRIDRELALTQAEALAFQAQRDTLRSKGNDLVVTAPRAGVVIGLPKSDELRRYWDKEERRPLCQIGDPTRLRALLPVSTVDYELLKNDQAYLRQRDSDLAATIRVQGHGGSTWRGQLAPLPLSECKDLPIQLTTRGGGPMAVKPNSPEGQNIPQAQLYLISVDFVDPDRTVYTGTMAQVKIHCRWRSGAWWVWRTLNDTFDLGLM
jgi:putative peptide zinc metalloprotease protein